MQNNFEVLDEFKCGALKDVLCSVTVSEDIGKRLGLPPRLLEKWLRQLSGQLDDLCRSADQPEPFSQKTFPAHLSAGEISFLLHDFETVAESRV